MEQTETEIPWNEVQSSNIARWRYDPDTNVMEIQFVSSDTTYSYDEVPRDVAEGIRFAGSAGQYFRNNIKDRYRFYKG